MTATPLIGLRCSGINPAAWPLFTRNTHASAIIIPPGRKIKGASFCAVGIAFSRLGARDTIISLINVAHISVNLLTKLQNTISCVCVCESLSITPNVYTKMKNNNSRAVAAAAVGRWLLPFLQFMPSLSRIIASVGACVECLDYEIWIPRLLI